MKVSPWQHLFCTPDPFSLTNPHVGRETGPQRSVAGMRMVAVWGLGSVRLELGMCLLLRVIRCVPGGACVGGSGKEEVMWGLNILSYYSHICF